MTPAGETDLDISRATVKVAPDAPDYSWWYRDKESAMLTISTWAANSRTQALISDKPLTIPRIRQQKHSISAGLCSTDDGWLILSTSPATGNGWFESCFPHGSAQQTVSYTRQVDETCVMRTHNNVSSQTNSDHIKIFLYATVAVQLTFVW